MCIFNNEKRYNIYCYRQNQYNEKSNLRIKYSYIYYFETNEEEKKIEINKSQYIEPYEFGNYDTFIDDKS